MGREGKRECESARENEYDTGESCLWPVCLPAALMDAGRMQYAGRTGRAARVVNINE